MKNYLFTDMIDVERQRYRTKKVTYGFHWFRKNTW